MIPKTIHYCWFGKNPKPAIVNKCKESWMKYMPDYKIIEWNEDNYDVNKSEWMREAYKEKKWAFVSDYARFDILNNYGGIYLDTDVELLKPIPDNIMNCDAFTGMESSGKVNPGLIFATISHHPFLEEILDHYDHSVFINDGGYKTVNEFTTEILASRGFINSDSFQTVYDINIYPSSFFCGYDQDVHDYDIKDNTISVHHYAGTWKKRGTLYHIQIFLIKVLGKNNYKKLLRIKRKFFGQHTR